MSLDTELVARALDIRLERGGGRPLAVAFSGGGDSLALLLLARRWADRTGRRLVAFTVDHRLQAHSGEWAARCASRAGRLGVAHEILAWEGAKPTRGIPAAARTARHRLIAEAARQAGARVVLMGHTADDLLESALMRAEGVRISDPAAWSPSPVWPEGRGIFIARPLLVIRRAAIRAWLADQGETWIDDPANERPQHPRARARAMAADLPFSAQPADRTPESSDFMIGPAGEFIVAGPVVQTMPLRMLGAAVTSVAGRERPPRRDALERLAARLATGEIVRATLGGARLSAVADRLIVARETADRRAAACQPMALDPGQTRVWDGRFEVCAGEPGLTLTALGGHAARLDRCARRQVAALHPLARASLPATIDAGGVVNCPTLAAGPRLQIRCLVGQRLGGAIGAIDSEAGIGL